MWWHCPFFLGKLGTRRGGIDAVIDVVSRDQLTAEKDNLPIVA